MRSEELPDPQLAPAPAFVTAVAVTEGFNRLASDLAEGLRAIVASARGMSAWPTWCSTCGQRLRSKRFQFLRGCSTPEGRELESPMHGHDLLAGKHLLEPRGAVPLGRADWLGFDTTPDIALVERVVLREFQQRWAVVIGDKQRFDAFIGVWQSNLDHEPCPMLNLSTRERCMLDFLWHEGPG